MRITINLKNTCLLIFFLILIQPAFSQSKATLTIDVNAEKTLISRHVYGHFSEHLGRCIYDGFWVNEGSNTPREGRLRLDVIDALKQINIPNLRWPGGCFADEYHWRDGIGPQSRRPRTINTHWGMVEEDNSFGTHEFLKLCDLLACEPYIAANVGSGTLQEMANWIEYLNFGGASSLSKLRDENGHPEPYQVKYWGIGNESWGCGGNMTAEYYADQYKRYATYARSYPEAPIKKIAGGANSDDYKWTEVLMENAARHMWGLSLHYYTLPTGKWDNKGSSVDFNEKEYFQTIKRSLFMDELITRHSAIMDKYDPEKRVALVVDEWGIWTDVEEGTNPSFLYQQNSLRDALIAGATLNIFNAHSDRVRMANLAQTVNVLQALVLTKGDQMLLTPTYHVFDMYKVHQDAKNLAIKLESPMYDFNGESIHALSVSASLDSTNSVHITMVNLDASNYHDLEIDLKGYEWRNVKGSQLTAGKVNDINTFADPENIKQESFKEYKALNDQLEVSLPPKSVVLLQISK